LNIGITCYPTHGGSGVVATELGKLLAEKGHQVHFITDHIPFRLGRFHRNIYYHKVEVSDYPVFRYPPYSLALSSRLAQVATEHRLDLLHVHYALPHAVAAYLAKKMVGDHLKIVTTLHGTDITVLGHDPSLKDLLRFAIDQSDAVTAVSQSLIDDTYKLIGPKKEIELVHNFIDKREYFPRNTEHVRLNFAEPDEKLLLHISNFRPVKRTRDVIEIFAKVRESVPSRLLLVGDGPDLCAIQCMAREMGLSEYIHFLGKQDEVSEIISLADVMLLPSETESFGLVALEGMACGVPTVATRVGGIPEVVVHGETGFLSNLGNVDEMAKYVIQICRDDELRQKLSAACIDRALHFFCSDDITVQYEQIYQNVLCPSSQPTA
jgi:N-acetyl-alpha-D-glucosaminyl L-malate synthase BshA